MKDILSTNGAPISDFHGRTIKSMKAYIDGVQVPFKSDWKCSGLIMVQFEIIFTSGEKMYIQSMNDGDSVVSFRYGDKLSRDIRDAQGKND